MGAGEGDADSAGAEVDGGGVFGNVCNAVSGESLYGDCYSRDKVVEEKGSEEVQVGAHEGRFGAWEWSLPHGSCSNPHVQ